jgi:hypothetical protein
MKVTEVVNLESQDPAGQVTDRAENVAVPGVAAVADVGTRLGKVFMPHNAQKNTAPDVSMQCGNRNAVAGSVQDPIVGTELPGTNLSILQRVQATGVWDVLAGLFQATEPAKRGATIKLGLTKPFGDIYEHLAGPSSLFAANSTHEIVEDLKTKLGGMPISAAGMVGTINCGGDLSCEQAAKIPYLGGGKITVAPDGLLPQLVTGIYDPNTSAPNAGRILKDMVRAAKTGEPVAARQVWQGLASYRDPVISEELSQN